MAAMYQVIDTKSPGLVAGSAHGQRRPQLSQVLGGTVDLRADPQDRLAHLPGGAGQARDGGRDAMVIDQAAARCGQVLPGRRLQASDGARRVDGIDDLPARQVGQGEAGESPYLPQARPDGRRVQGEMLADREGQADAARYMRL